MSSISSSDSFTKKLFFSKTRPLITYAHHYKVRSCAAFISVYEKCHQWKAAESVFMDMELKYLIEPDNIAFNAMISAYQKGGQWEKAEEVFEKMISKGIKPDSISCNSLISALTKGELFLFEQGICCRTRCYNGSGRRYYLGHYIQILTRF